MIPGARHPWRPAPASGETGASDAPVRILKKELERWPT
jgi:hypothetical protein